jgi:hypothetical protein
MQLMMRDSALLMIGGVLAGDESCCCGDGDPCPDACSFEAINPDLVSDTIGGGVGNYTLNEDGHIYGLTISVSHDVEPCVNAFYGTFVNPRPPILSGVNAPFNSDNRIPIENTAGTLIGWHEGYWIKCSQDAQTMQLLYGEGEVSGCDEWTFYGRWPEFMTPGGVGFSVVIGEQTGGAWFDDGSFAAGTFTVLSLNPFHAIAVFEIPADGVHYYPMGPGGFVSDCGPITVEFME